MKNTLGGMFLQIQYSRRPVVSSLQYHESKIFKLVNNYFHPHAENFPYYIKDENHFPNKLEKLENVRTNTFIKSHV